MPSKLLDTIFNMAGFAMGKIKRILCSVWLWMDVDLALFCDFYLDSDSSLFIEA